MNFLSRTSPSAILEPLEQRIAPALLVSGANLLGGAGNATTGETSIGDNAFTLVKVLSGNAIVWYDGQNISAISVGPNTSIDITGNVGDIIANLTASGRLSDSNNDPSDGEDGNVLLANNIVGIKTHPTSGEKGDINDIITGGSISNLSINGELHGAYAGDGAFRTGSHALTGNAVDVALPGFDVNPIVPDAQGSFHLTKNGGLLSGASISNAVLQTAKELQLYAGNGNDGAVGKPGAIGGSVQNLVIVSAFIGEASALSTPSYDIQAGDGGAGTVGGAGGGITKIIEKSSSGVAHITAGHGGHGSNGAGGAGGSVKNLDMQSDSSSYTVTAGKGGSGAPGGAGGQLGANNFSGKAPSTGIIVSADFTGDGIDDLLVVDSGTGTMIVEKNSGDGSSFAPVVQDDLTTPEPQDDLLTIPAKGTTPDAAIAVDVNGDNLLDIVVSYKNSNSLGIYLNRGGGVFMDQEFAGLVYTGSTPSGTSLGIGYSPTKIAAGNFTGSGDMDIAVLVSDTKSSQIFVAAGDGLGGFGLLDSIVTLPKQASDLVAAPIKGSGYLDLFVGFQTGLIVPLLSTGAASGDAFNIGSSSLSEAGGVANLDVDPATHRLLALSVAQTNLSVFNYDTSGGLSLASGPDLTLQTGKPLVAHFVQDNLSAEAPIEVLSLLTGGSRIDEYTQSGGAFQIAATVQSSSTLKNFVPVIEGGSTGVAALGGSLAHFSFSQSGAGFVDYGLPFSGKKVTMVAGDGGDGLNLSAKLIGKGGLGGSIIGVNISAGDISLQAGQGGDSDEGAAGAGGSIQNTPVLVTSSGSVTPILDADTSLVLHAGDGGAPSGSALTASGGSGGSIATLHLLLASGNIQVFAGDGQDGNGGVGGNGGSITNLVTLASDGDFVATAGKGGTATSGKANGGFGGSITGVKHSLILSDATELLEKAYNVTLAAGGGGSSTGGLAGAGGGIALIDLTLDPSKESFDDPTTPADERTFVDSTVRISLTSGDGGDGTIGGNAGAIKSVKSTTIFDQYEINPVTHARIVARNPVVMSIVSGMGGIGSAGAGGAGGSITLGGTGALNGITWFDRDISIPESPLTIQAGDGGFGSSKGGAGGSIAAVSTGNSLNSDGTALVANQLRGAHITAGNGGDGGSSDGGAGGAVGTLSIGVELGPILISSGNGGAGGVTVGSLTGKGGAGGNINTALLGSTISGIGVLAGFGGNGVTGGGAGGAISAIKINGPQDSGIFSAAFRAGDGGQASGAGAMAGKGFVGGKGGDVTGVSQSKDVNSAINIVEAGNGGASTGAFGVGGAGGNVTGIQTVGMIGIASDDVLKFGAFDGANAQGIFSGRGGAGSKAGLAGAVTSVVARQISAIGANVDANGLFGLASKVSNIKADLIGFDVNGGGTFDSSSGILSPSAAKPIDGFILASAISSINTLNNTRTALFEFTA